MKSYLSGMPECKFGINDKITIEGKGKGGGASGSDDPSKRLERDHRFWKRGKNSLKRDQLFKKKISFVSRKEIPNFRKETNFPSAVVPQWP